jgi:RecG-like helicase
MALGQTKGKARSAAEAQIATGAAQLVIGTHALFQDNVKFAKLGLVIIDEQHRFGVDQRLALRNKGDAQYTPHQLVMTATPIPRTLAMSAYGDLDTSIIDELPLGVPRFRLLRFPSTAVKKCCNALPTTVPKANKPTGSVHWSSSPKPSMPKLLKRPIRKFSSVFLNLKLAWYMAK